MVSPIAVRRCPWPQLLLGLLALWTSSLAPASTRGALHPVDEAISFEKQVAPIFQQHCFSCHNDHHSEGDFSIQSREGFQASGYVEPGAPDGSYLLDLVRHSNDDPAQMPQDAAPLSVQQYQTLATWIEEGAAWPPGFKVSEPVVSDFQWWSLQPLERPVVPQVTANANTDAQSQQAIHPVDAFLQSAWQDKGLTPNPPAAPAQLIRRLCYDLTGLPPAAEEIQRFVADPSPEVYQQLVDHYLASPRYGERWGRHWLDLVRYADTCGYDKDKLRPNAWPYRDYVIRSFNEDKPYTRFVKEQLAGDVFFPETVDGIVGLGFIAAGPWDFIGHVEVPESKLDGKEARNLDRDEMVSATFNVFSSTTVQCARCHNHKFDPITQEHYYDLQAVFAGVDRADRPFDPSSEASQLRKERLNLLADLEQQLEECDRRFLGALGPDFQQWQQEYNQLRDSVKPEQLTPAYGYHSELVGQKDSEKWFELRWQNPVDIRQVILHPCYDDFAGIGAGFGFPEKWKLDIRDTEQQARTVATSTSLQQGQVLPLQLSVSADRTTALRLTATELAHRQNDYHLSLAEIVVLDSAGKNVAPLAEVAALDSIEAPPRWGRQNLTDGAFPIYSEEKSSRLETLLLQLQDAKKKAGGQYLQEKQRLRSLEAKAREQIAALPPRAMVYAATSKFQPNGNFQPTGGTPRPVYRLNRGQVSQPGELAAPGTIPLRPDLPTQFSLKDPNNESSRRAALATWIVDRENPLTWRSIVNRLWLHHFGQGLVATPNDFGRMGQMPSHPELLDWLACEFRDGGQSMKQLHRLLVTSQAYQRSSADNPACREIDQDNQFYWRMNRRRLSAEELRDSMLQVAGVLNLKMGGPGYYLFELEKPEHSPHYQYHLFDPADPETHRRTIYRFVVRSQPDPLMATFDCADSSQSVPQRDQTLTALQALSLMNNRFVLMASQKFRESLENQSDELESQIARGFKEITGRDATAAEQEALVAYGQKHGLENACRVLFNLNEFVFVD